MALSVFVRALWEIRKNAYMLLYTLFLNAGGFKISKKK